MPIKFNEVAFKPAPKMYRVLIPDANINYVASIGSDQKKHRKTDMHYDRALNRLVPCQHEDCLHCPKYIPVRVVTYVPALVFKNPKAGFLPEILAVTDSWREVLEEDLRRWLFEFKRSGGKKTTITWSRKQEKDADVGEFLGFDIEPSLYRVWGLRNWQWSNEGTGTP